MGKSWTKKIFLVNYWTNKGPRNHVGWAYLHFLSSSIHCLMFCSSITYFASFPSSAKQTEAKVPLRFQFFLKNFYLQLTQGQFGLQYLCLGGCLFFSLNKHLYHLAFDILHPASYTNGFNYLNLKSILFLQARDYGIILEYVRISL